MIWSYRLVPGSQVYLVEIYALTTGLQLCSKNVVITVNSAAKIDPIKHEHNCDYCSYLVYRPHVPSWPGRRTYR